MGSDAVARVFSNPCGVVGYLEQLDTGADREAGVTHGRNGHTEPHNQWLVTITWGPVCHISVGTAVRIVRLPGAQLIG